MENKEEMKTMRKISSIKKFLVEKRNEIKEKIDKKYREICLKIERYLEKNFFDWFLEPTPYGYYAGYHYLLVPLRGARFMNVDGERIIYAVQDALPKIVVFGKYVGKKIVKIGKNKNKEKPFLLVEKLSMDEASKYMKEIRKKSKINFCGYHLAGSNWFLFYYSEPKEFRKYLAENKTLMIE